MPSIFTKIINKDLAKQAFRLIFQTEAGGQRWFVCRRRGFLQKGQSLIEALILSWALISLMSLVLLIFWIWTNIIWIEHQLYQGLICAAQQKDMRFCKEALLSQIKKFNPPGRIKFLKIKNFQNQWKGEIIWIFYNKKFSIQQILSLPR